MKIQVLLLFAVLTFTSNIYSQVTQNWASVYNGPNNFSDFSTCLAVDNSGNVYAAGYVYQTNLPIHSDYCIVKYNSTGIRQWVVTYNGDANGTDIINSIAIDNLGNIYVTGESESNIGGRDIITIKYNSDGIQQWKAVFDGALAVGEVGIKILLDVSGNVFVGGYVFRGPIATMSDDIVVLKYNSSGVLQWSSFYNNSGNQEDRLTCMALDSQGNIYAGGHSTAGVLVNDDFVLIKYNSNGQQQWVKTYNGLGNDDDNVTSLGVDKQGNVFVTGTSMGTDTYYDYATIKYNPQGVEQWSARYSFVSNSSDNPVGIVVDTLGNSYVTGTSASYIATIKYNSSGVEQWVARNEYGGAYSFVMDNSMNLYITGYSSSNGQECAIIKYNSYGVQKWITKYKYNNNNSNTGKEIKIDNSGKIYVTGNTCATVPNNYDFLTLQYTQEPTNITSVGNQIPDKFSLQQNYPNPFNPSTNIEFSVPENSFVNLKVFDITGKQIEELVNDSFIAGNYKYDFNAKSLPSGTYFYKLETEKFTEIKKMILLK